LKKVEATGRTTEEALHDAALQLGVTVDALEYEIVEEGSKGFLGLGQTPTLVRAWVGETEAPKARPQPQVEPVEETKQEEKEVQMVEVPQQPEEQLKAEPQPTEAPDDDVDKLAEELVAFLGDVLTAMQLDAKAEVKSIDPQEVLIEIVGKDVGVLVGAHGQTLDALQYITGILASRVSQSRRRIILDGDGYRERLREVLRQKALEYAKAVVEAGQEAVLEPQPARDRRIVHLALAEHPDVYTYSEGEGDQRHVVISPKK
jgi:spoIIIJ-associated protein